MYKYLEVQNTVHGQYQKPFEFTVRYNDVTQNFLSLLLHSSVRWWEPSLVCRKELLNKIADFENSVVVWLAKIERS